MAQEPTYDFLDVSPPALEPHPVERPYEVIVRLIRVNDNQLIRQLQEGPSRAIIVHVDDQAEPAMASLHRKQEKI